MNSERMHSEGVRIVQIETRYVETDALNFRSVVQSLTGKDASMVWARKRPREAKTGLEIKGVNNNSNAHAAYGGVVGVKPNQGFNNININSRGGSVGDDFNADALSRSMKLKNLSFKDLERLLPEFPLVEELPWLN